MSPTPSAVRVAAGLALALALTGCATTTGDAGVRVTTSDTPTSSAVVSPGASAPADLVASAALADCPASDPKVAALDDGLPDIVLPCLGDGPEVRLAGLRGTPTVVNVWASWCGPCREELALFADLAGSTSGSLRVLGLDATDDAPSALSLLTDAGVHYASVRDDTGQTKAPMAWGSGLPVTYFVDADGHVVFAQHGAVSSADELNRLVTEHLGVTVPA